MKPRMIGRYRWRVVFKPQDCWIGVFWEMTGDFYHVWICLVPMVPLHVWWRVA